MLAACFACVVLASWIAYFTLADAPPEPRPDTAAIEHRLCVIRVHAEMLRYTGAEFDMVRRDAERTVRRLEAELGDWFDCAHAVAAAASSASQSSHSTTYANRP